MSAILVKQLRCDCIATDQNHVVELKVAGTSPPPRVGSASATIEDKIFLFSGRGGESMTPIEELGSFWVFDTTHSSWSLLGPANASDPFPPPRSYHCATSDSSKQIFVHAGCPTTGRLADLWSFNVETRVWTQHAEAPAPPRGGSSIAFSRGKLYRMNGFDGKKEQGGTVDVYSLESDTWDFNAFTADGESGPAARSVGALLPVTIQGKHMLVTLFGEGDPSSLGHAGAGKMFGDVWAYDTDLETWHIVETESSTHQQPPPRGWFGATLVDASTIVVCGGLAESNERLQDCWLLKFQS